MSDQIAVELFLGLDEGELSAELKINHGLNAAVDLEESGSSLARNDSIENGNVSDAELVDLSVDVERTLDQADGLVVGHGAPGVGVFLDEGVLLVVDFDKVGGVLVVDGPEFGGLVGSELKIGGDQLFLLGADILTKKFHIIVELLLLAARGRLSGG